MQQGVCLITVLLSSQAEKNKSVTPFRTSSVWVTASLFVSIWATRGHYCKECCRNQSHLWHAQSDNVVEMEMSCSNMDEDGFAAVIGSATLLHGRGEWGCQCLKKQLSVCFLPPLLFTARQAGQRALLSTFQESSARAFHKGEEEEEKTFMFFPPPFPCMKSNGNHGNLALHRT